MRPRALISILIICIIVLSGCISKPSAELPKTPATINSTIKVINNITSTNVSNSVNSTQSGSVSSTLNSGLDAYWKFDEGTGSSTVDSSGNGYIGTLVNLPIWVQGKNGYALTFDSSDRGALGVTANKEYVATNYHGIGGANARTFAAWVRTTCNRACDIVTYGTETPGERIEWSIEGEILGLRTFVGYVLYDAPKLNDGNWHHVAVVVPAGAMVSDVLFYEDGQRLTSRNSESRSSVRIDTGNDNLVNIGRMYAGAKVKGNLNTPTIAAEGGAYFRGTIDDLRIYNRTLTDSEIKDLYQK